jgi:phosphohistidine swiveling domain-containing protein
VSILWLAEIGLEQASRVGGKGLQLGRLTTAGLPVPNGFVITEDAYRTCRAASDPLEMSPALIEECLAAYHKLGGGFVAVRSSATSEDGATASFAGQQETILGVEGEDALLAAVLHCWKSLDTERAMAYRREQGLDDAAAAMAVVVQRLVPAEVSGVLFTHDPLDASGTRLLIEAAFGLGEAVVSGRVMPDRFHLSRATGEVLEQSLSEKRERLTAKGWEEIPQDEQRRATLNADQLQELSRLSSQIENYYGGPRDVEWAFANGQFFILQARPITTSSAAELEKVRRAEIERVQQLAGPRVVIWARYNLSEVLPAPLPLTWSIVRRFMSGQGAYGQMFRDLGYDPDPALDSDGFIDLICGRPYVNLDREPLLYFRDFPYGYDFAAIRQAPELGMYPKLETIASRKTARFWWRLPGIIWAMVRSSSRIPRLMASGAEQLTRDVYPQFVQQYETDCRQQVLAELTHEDLLKQSDVWLERIKKFASQSLRPGLFAATALAELEQLLTQAQVKDAAAAARRLVMGVHPPPDCDLAGALQNVAAGSMSQSEFLKSFGHRAPGEMELAEPRFSEAAEKLPTANPTQNKKHDSPLVGLAEVVDFRKHANLRDRLSGKLEQARTYLALREASKHYLMLGFARLREIYREVGRRLELGDAIFYLAIDDIPLTRATAKTAELRKQCEDAKRQRKLLLSLPVLPVLFSDDLAAIGRPIEITGATELTGTPLSFGDFTGPALVLEEPIDPSGLTAGFVLVCPSTDPAWVPLFLKAGALVMESGGVLSHGAIVAREFGIPAVAGIPGVHQLLTSGQRLHVDGATGRVHVLKDE